MNELVQLRWKEQHHLWLLEQFARGEKPDFRREDEDTGAPTGVCCFCGEQHYYPGRDGHWRAICYGYDFAVADDGTLLRRESGCIVRSSEDPTVRELFHLRRVEASLSEPVRGASGCEEWAVKGQLADVRLRIRELKAEVVDG
jgi:hypothetical protein